MPFMTNIVPGKFGNMLSYIFMCDKKGLFVANRAISPLAYKFNSFVRNSFDQYLVT